MSNLGLMFMIITFRASERLGGTATSSVLSDAHFRFWLKSSVKGDRATFLVSGELIVYVQSVL